MTEIQLDCSAKIWQIPQRYELLKLFGRQEILRSDEILIKICIIFHDDIV